LRPKNALEVLVALTEEEDAEVAVPPTPTLASGPSNNFNHS